MTEWIVSSAVLIVVIALVRQLLKGRISLQLQYALWAIVLVRLLVPVSFGQSKLSVQNVVQAEQSVQTEQGEPAETPGITIDIPPSRVDYVAPDLSVVEPDPSLPEAERQEQYEQNVQQWQNELDADWEEYKAENTRHVTLSVTDILYLVWIAGMAVTAVIFAVSNLRFRLRLRRSRRPLEAVSWLPVYLTGAVETPCLFGLFRPAVYVTPEVAEDEVALGHVLAHEETHCRHGDHIWALLRCLCLVIHWYNPLVWLAAALSRRDSELACDAGTIRRIGEGERAAYGSTLIGLTCAHRSNLLHTATTMMGSKKSIKERIVLIAKKPKMAVYTLIAVILIAAVAVGCTFTGAEKSGEENVGEENVESLFSAQTVTKHWEIVKSVEVENLTYADVHDIVGAVLYRDLKTNAGGIAFVEKDGCYSLGLSAQVYEDSTLVYEGAGTVLFYLQNEDGEPYECRVTLSFSETGVIQLHSESEFAEPPSFVQVSAEVYIEQRRTAVEQEYIAVSVTHEVLSELKGLTELDLGTAGLDYAVEMWRLDYDITVAINHGQEAYTAAHTAYLVFLYDYMTEEYTRFLGSVDDETLLNVYNTPEMIGKYGDMHRAAAMELYGQYVEASKQLDTPAAPSSGLYNLTKRGDTVSLTLHTREGGEQRTFVLDYQSDAWRTSNLRTGVSWNLLDQAPEGTWDYWLTYTSEDGTVSITFYAGENGPVCYRDEQRTIWWTERGGTPDAETLREEVYDPLMASTAPEYDIFSDPNVLWAEGPDSIDMSESIQYYLGKIILRTWRLDELLNVAAPENLIAFRAMQYKRDSDPPFVIDIEKLVIPDELNEDGVLTAMLERYASAGTPEARAAIRWDEISWHIRTVIGDLPTEYTGPDELRGDYYESFNAHTALEKEREQIEIDIANELLREWDVIVDPSTATDEELAEESRLFQKVLGEAEVLALEKQRYQEILAQLERYDELRVLADEFWDSWNIQSWYRVRNRFIELGFTPVYSEEEIGYSSYRAVTFVGTAEQILQLEEITAEDESVGLIAAQKPQTEQ